jgi:hypothetical protein
MNHLLLRRLDSDRVIVWSLWIAALVAAVAAVISVAVGLTGGSQLAPVAQPLAIAVAVLIASALLHARAPVLLAGLLYAGASLALLYGIVLAMSIPVRVMIEDVCQPAPAPCPLGFQRPVTSAEASAVYSVIICAATALAATFVAVEASYRRRSRSSMQSDVQSSRATELLQK